MKNGYEWINFTKPLPLMAHHAATYGLCCPEGGEWIGIKIIESWERHFASKKIKTRRRKKPKGTVLQIRIPIY